VTKQSQFGRHYFKPYKSKKEWDNFVDDVVINNKKRETKKPMMNVLLTGGAGATGIELIGQYPAADTAQQIGQLVLQILVAVITIIKLVKEKKTEK